MAYGVQHVHLKTRDPKQTMQFYIDNFGATLKAEIPGRGFRLDLHGLQLNITTLIASQKHEQQYGIEVDSRHRGRAHVDGRDIHSLCAGARALASLTRALCRHVSAVRRKDCR